MTHIPALPYVTLKLAQTLDGRIATHSGHSRWVSSPGSRSMVHRLRAAHDAVLIGIGTVLADDPQLTVRLASGPHPTRVVMDSSLRLPLNSAVLNAMEAPTIVLTLVPSDSAGARAVCRLGAEVLTMPSSRGRVDAVAALHALYVRGIRSILVEGGSQVSTEFIRRQLVDELVIFIAPKIIGSGIDAIGDLGVTAMTKAIRFSSHEFTDVEGDIMFRGKPVWPD